MISNQNNKDDDKNNNKLQSSFHTLFKENVSEKRNEKTINGKTYYEITPTYTNFRMFIDSFDETKNSLHEIFNTLWNAGDRDTLELRIHSFGGHVKEGQNFFNIIRNKFNGRTTTILDSAGYSMGALLFCAGDKRIVTEQSDLMFHDYSTMEWGKGGEIEASVEHHRKHLRNFFKDLIVSNKFLSPEEFEQMIIGKDFWMEVPEMCERGIATHVMVNGKTIKASKYLKSLKKNKKDVEKKKK